MHPRLSGIAFGFLAAIWSAAAAAQFTTVINVPPNTVPTTVGSDTQVNVYSGGVVNGLTNLGNPAGGSTNVQMNVFDGSVGVLLQTYSGSTLNVSGGTLQSFADFNSGSVVNISGGTVGEGMDANGGSTVNISGGRIGTDFDCNSGSTCNLSGGTYAEPFEAKSGSALHIYGGELRLNGALVSGLTNVGDSAPLSGLIYYVISGTFADGSPFAFSNFDSDFISQASVTLHAASVPAAAPLTITASTDPIPAGLRGGQSLVVDSGGTVGADFNAGWGSNVTIQAGGTVGKNFEATGATVTMTGGTVGDVLDVNHGTIMHLSGGVVGQNVDVQGGTLNISGGKVGNFLDAIDGGTVNVTGGSVGDYFTVRGGGKANISGGEVGPGFVVFSSSGVKISGGLISDIDSEIDNALDLYGGDFRINGVPISGLPNDGDTLQTILPLGCVFTGTFADGTPFVFNNANGDDSIGIDNFGYSTIALHRTAVPAPTGPAVRTASIDGVPKAIREGQTLIVDSGSSLGRNFIAGRGSTLIVQPGATVGGVELSDATATISGGTIGGLFSAINSTVNISGGTFGSSFRAKGGSVVTITGGTFDSYMTVLSNSTINLQGGTIGDYFQAGDASGLTTNAHFNISGGSVGKNMSIFNGATVTLSGGSIAGFTDTTTLNQGGVLNITGGTLSGILTAKTGSTVNVSSGTVGYQLLAKGGAVNVTGGRVNEIIADSGSAVNFSGGETYALKSTGVGTVNVSGGLISGFDGLWVDAGGKLNVSGGRVAGLSGNNSTVKLTGGALYYAFNVAGSSTLDIYGGDFRIGGTPVGGLGTVGSTVQVIAPSQLSGTLADGTPFGFGITDFDSISTTVTLHAAALPAIGPSVITASAGPIPLGIRQGQTLVVDSGATVPEGFIAGWGSTMIVQPGGATERYGRLVGARMKVEGGNVGPVLAVLNGSTVDLTSGVVSTAQVGTGGTFNAVGGTLGSFSETYGGTINVVGGAVGESLKSYSGGVVNVRGGSVGDRVDVFSGGTLNLYGGTVGDDFDAASGSFVNIFGSQFLLNGAPISGLTLNTPFLVSTRNATLTGTLLDGTPFSFDLYSTDQFNRDFFSGSATLKLVQYVAGDINHDGFVNTGDYATWRKGLGTTFTQGYYDVWRSRYGASSGSGLEFDGTGAVPEPAACMMILLGTPALFCRRRP